MKRKTDCVAYNSNYETVKTLIGYANKDPIYSEKDVLVTEYCSAHDSYDFNCETCKLHKIINGGKKN